jgi:hypothetical protein
VHRLAELCGAEVFAAGDGRVHFRAPADGPADHVFRYREHVLDLDVLAQPPVHAGVVVYGEGAASKAGADKAHVLVTDLDSVKGTAGDDGAAALHVVDGAVRTGDDATRLARAQLAQIQSRQVQLGDRVGIDDLPSDHRAAPALAGGKALRVRSVRHTLRPGAGQGFTTRIGF